MSPDDEGLLRTSPSSQEAEVAQVSLSPTPFSLTHDFAYPVSYPVVLFPTLPSYLSPVEWSSLLTTVNSSLVYPPSFLLLHCLCLLLCLLLLALNYTVAWTDNLWWEPWLRWSLIVAAMLAWWWLARRLRDAAYRRMQRAVVAESSRWETAEPSMREGRLPCHLTVGEGGQLLVTPVVGYAPPPLPMRMDEPP